MFQDAVARGQDLGSKQDQVSGQRAVQKWVKTLKKQWSRLRDEVLARRNKLHAANAIKQVSINPRRARVFVTIILMF